MDGEGCLACARAGVACDQGRPCGRCASAGDATGCSLRRKRGRPRKPKPDPNAPKPHTVPKPLSLRPAPFVVTSASAPQPQPSPSINLGQRPAPHRAAEVFACHSGMRTAPPHAWAMPTPSPTPSAAATPHHVSPPSWPREPQSGRANTPRFEESPPPPRGHDRAHKRKRSSSHGSDADLDEQESTTSIRRSRERRKEKRGNGACAEPTPQTAVVPGVLQLLIDELRDMRRSVKCMKKDVHKLSSKQLCFSDMQHELAQTLDSIPLPLGTGNEPCPSPSYSTSSSSSSSSSSSPWTSSSREQSSMKAETSYSAALTAVSVQALYPHLHEPTRAMRKQFVLQFPFLACYNLDTRDVPFVIDDLHKPIAIGRIMPDPTRMRLPMPHIVYANEAFCATLNYELHELQGCPISKIGIPTEAQKARMLEHLLHRAHPDLGDVLHFEMLMRRKDGSVIRTSSRAQVFFDGDGNAAWNIVCVDGVSPVSAPPPPASTIWDSDPITDSVSWLLFPSYYSSPSSGPSPPTTSSPWPT